FEGAYAMRRIRAPLGSPVGSTTRNVARATVARSCDAVGKLAIVNESTATAASPPDSHTRTPSKTFAATPARTPAPARTSAPASARIRARDRAVALCARLRMRCAGNAGTGIAARAPRAFGAKSDCMRAGLQSIEAAMVVVVAEQFAQAVARASQPRAHGRVPHPQRRGDLLAGKIVEIKQHGHLA